MPPEDEGFRDRLWTNRQWAHFMGFWRDPSPGLSWQQNPAVLMLNGSFLVHTFGASLVAQVSSGDTFARAHIHSACGHRAHLDTGLQHAWPPLQALGVPSNNHIRVSVGGDEPPRAQLEVALGLCTLTARGDFRSEASVTHNWTLALVNHCPLLEVSPPPHMSVWVPTSLYKSLTTYCMPSFALSMGNFGLFFSFAVVT